MLNFDDSSYQNPLPQTFTFKVKSCKEIPNPYKNDPNALPNAAMYIVLCDIQDLPQEQFPMGTNPREQKMTTNVVKKIKETLFETENPVFYLLNRGILLSAASVKYEPYNQNLTVVFDDPDVHGNVDGGHTYRAILDNRAKLANYGGSKQYVKLEILTGVEDVFQRLAAARNTSVQVDDSSIAELENRFDIIKDALKDTPLNGRIAFKENAEIMDENLDVDVKEIVSILNMFDIARYPDFNVCPTTSYGKPKTCIDYYIRYHKENAESEQQNNPFYKMRYIIKDIFQLYDRIETNMHDFYTVRNPKGRYHAMKGIVAPKEKENFRSQFYQDDLRYRSPNGFLYPIVGAFRALIEEKDGVYGWKLNPFDLLPEENIAPKDREKYRLAHPERYELGANLLETVISNNRSLGNNPNITGRNPNVWKQLYLQVAFTMQTAVFAKMNS